MVAFIAATADEVLNEVEEQEEWERCRIIAAKEVPRGEWASKNDLGRKFNPRDRVHELDNLRTILILILTVYDSVLETISNDTGSDIEKDHPIQFAILSLFTGIYRVIVVSLFFYVSGLSSWIILVLRRDSSLRFLFKKTRKTIGISVGCYIVSKATEYMYGPFPANFLGSSNPSYYASRDGKISLLRGPIYYSIMLLILDFLFVFCRTIHRNYMRYDLVERLVGTKSNFRVTSFMVPLVFIGLYPLLVLSGFITFPARIQSFFNIHAPIDAHTPFIFILAYAAAVNQNNLQLEWLEWLRPEGKVVTPRLIMVSIRDTLISATVLFIPLYHYYPSTIALYISPKLPPHPVLNSDLTPSSAITAAALYIMWMEYLYRWLLVTFASALYIRDIPCFLGRNYHSFTSLAYIQTVIHMFFIVGFARHSSWIGSSHPILRCIFVASCSILCGWAVVLVPLYSYRLAKVWFRGIGSAAEREGRGGAKEVNSMQEASTNREEIPLVPVERGGGEESKQVSSPTMAEAEETMSEAPSTSASTGKAVAGENTLNGTTPLASSKGDDPNGVPSSAADDTDSKASERHSIPRRRKFILTLSLARAFLTFLLILHTSIIAVVAYSPDSTQSSSPKYFAAISFFAAFHQVFVVPAFFFLSGISAYISLSTKYSNRTPFLLPWDRSLALLFVGIFNHVLESGLERLDRLLTTATSLRQAGAISLAARKPGDIPRFQAPVDYILFLVLLDFGYCVLKTSTTRHSKGLAGLNSGRRFYFTLQGIALCAQFIYLCATLAGRDPFLSERFTRAWKLDAHFPLLYVNAYAMGVNFSQFRAAFFNADSSRSRRRKWAWAVKTGIVRIVIACAILWVLYYRIYPLNIQGYIDPSFYPHRVLDPGSSTSPQTSHAAGAGAIVAYACWSMTTFLLLIESIASFILSTHQESGLVSKCPESAAYYAREAVWFYALFHAAPAVMLDGRTPSWMKDVGVRIGFVVVGSVMFVSALMWLINRLVAWWPVRAVVVMVVMVFKLQI